MCKSVITWSLHCAFSSLYQQEPMHFKYLFTYQTFKAKCENKIEHSDINSTRTVKKKDIWNEHKFKMHIVAM